MLSLKHNAVPSGMNTKKDLKNDFFGHPLEVGKTHQPAALLFGDTIYYQPLLLLV